MTRELMAVSKYVCLTHTCVLAYPFHVLFHRQSPVPMLKDRSTEDSKTPPMLHSKCEGHIGCQRRPILWFTAFQVCPWQASKQDLSCLDLCLLAIEKHSIWRPQGASRTCTEALESGRSITESNQVWTAMVLDSSRQMGARRGWRGGTTLISAGLVSPWLIIKGLIRHLWRIKVDVGVAAVFRGISSWRRREQSHCGFLQGSREKLEALIGAWPQPFSSLPGC